MDSYTNIPRNQWSKCIIVSSVLGLLFMIASMVFIGICIAVRQQEIVSIASAIYILWITTNIVISIVVPCSTLNGPCTLRYLRVCKYSALFLGLAWCVGGFFLYFYIGCKECDEMIVFTWLFSQLLATSGSGFSICTNKMAEMKVMAAMNMFTEAML